MVVAVHESLPGTSLAPTHGRSLWPLIGVLPTAASVAANAFGLGQPQPRDDGVMAIKIPGNGPCRLPGLELRTYCWEPSFAGTRCGLSTMSATALAPDACGRFQLPHG